MPLKQVYVDDTQIMNAIKREKDVEDLQDYLEQLYVWAKEHNMVSNGTKFHVIRYGHDEDIKKNTLQKEQVKKLKGLKLYGTLV